MKRAIFALAVGALLVLPSVAHAGVGGPAFYVNGVVYRTVGTPTDLSNTGAPDGVRIRVYASISSTVPSTRSTSSAAPS